jgi:SAM-dependent methyltransferase
MQKEHRNALDKAAQLGEPSYVWRAGQERRFSMIRLAMGDRVKGKVLEDGCDRAYVTQLSNLGGVVVGLERDVERALEARKKNAHILCGAGENLPFGEGVFDALLSHEVIEHVEDDRKAIREMARVLKPGGRLVLFCPNRGYPFETHGIFWRGKYVFGNIPLVNYLPIRWRNRLAPHVRVYTQKDLSQLFDELPLKVVQRTYVWGL